MALIGNGVRLGNSNPMRVFAGSIYGANPANYYQPGSKRNAFASAEWEPKSGIPDGYRHPGAWMLPQTAGGLSSRFALDGSGDVSGANLAGGLNAESAIAGTGTVSADGFMGMFATATLAGLATLSPEMSALGALAATLAASGDVSTSDLTAAINAAANLAGTGQISDAQLAAILAAAATITGTATVSADVSGALNAAAAIAGTSAVSADVIGVWDMLATVAGTSTLTAALTALGHVTADIIGAGTVSAAATADGNMSANLSLTGEAVTPATVAAAVWNALVASYQSAGTFGEAIANGSAGLTQQQIRDAMALGTGDTPASGSIDELLLELYRLAGLDPTRPLVVTATSRDAGAEISQTVVEAPAGTVTVTRT